MFNKFALIFLLLTLASCTYTFFPAECGYPTAGSISKIGSLSDSLNETSGLEILKNRFVSFNDSGGDPALYVFSDSSSLIHKTIIRNATNVDWEDITYDGTFFYVADVGNNFGTRDTLMIYKMHADSIESFSHTETAQYISFSYDEQVSRTETGMYSHDCEAIFTYGDSLYLFAKDWVTLSTRIYVLPKSPGHYNISSKITYQVKALITGADIDIANREVVLLGYRNMVPVLIRYGFDKDPAAIECGGIGRRYPRFMGTQMEGVCFDESGRIFITSEKRLYKQALYRVY